MENFNYWDQNQSQCNGEECNHYESCLEAQSFKVELQKY